MTNNMELINEIDARIFELKHLPITDLIDIIEDEYAILFNNEEELECYVNEKLSR